VLLFKQMGLSNVGSFVHEADRRSSSAIVDYQPIVGDCNQIFGNCLDRTHG
jgi:hypothetical protein